MHPNTPARWPNTIEIQNLYAHSGPGINELWKLGRRPGRLAELMRALHRVGRLDGYKRRDR